MERVEETAGQGGTLVMLHAAGSGPRALGGLARLLATMFDTTDRPALPLTVDSATTEPGGSPLSFQILTARIALDQPEERRPVVLFGHSFGGLVALLAMLAGARVDACVLYEPVAFGALDWGPDAGGEDRAWDRALVDELEKTVAEGNPEAGVARFIEGWNEVAWGTLPPATRQALVADAHRLAALTAAVHHHPLDVSAVRRIDAPVLLLTGTRSPRVVRRIAAHLSRELRQCELHGLDAGHMGPLLAPDLVAPVIIDWLERTLTRAHR